jgi:hypothetical protein
MKSKHFVLAATAVAPLGFAQVGIAVQPPNARDLTLGKWELQVSKSHFCTDAPQKSARDNIDAGWGVVSVLWTGVDAKGNPINVRYVYRLDGQKYPSDITKPSGVAISWIMVNPSRVEFVDWSKDDKKIAENVRTVSADGQTMTQTTKYVPGEGGKKECVDTQIFERQ